MNEQEVLSYLKSTSEKCIRCGFCVQTCPSWIAHGKLEYYSPRARVSLVLGMLDGSVSPEDAVESIYTCNTCRRCLVECPTGVDTAELAIYARYYINQRLAGTK